MPLTSGTALGPYTVTGKIGEGGMGEVHQARDTTLDRDVTLNVLPQALASDPDRLARFEREAKVLDFGLAKAFQSDATADPNMSMSPTMSLTAATAALHAPAL